MNERRIKLSEVSPAEPESLPMPLDEALRWISPHEDEIDEWVPIFLMQRAYLYCTAHAGSDLSREVGGVLVGQIYRREDSGLYVIVESGIQAQYTQFGPTHLTFTQNSLVQLNNELEERFPGKRMVGWYHTHPRMDVFMSSYDTWLHLHLFDQPWQVALVIEPYAERGGFFCWQPGRQLDPHRYVGFYELADISYESIVNWDNLEPEEEDE